MITFQLIFNYFILISSIKAQIYRLLDYNIPIHYEIEITPYFEPEDHHEAFTFDGYVNISISCDNGGVNQIQIHNKSLEINEESIEFIYSTTGVETIGINRIEYEELTEKMILYLNASMNRNVPYYLLIQYTGKIDDDMIGLYRSSYIDNGNEMNLAVTQLQQTEARKLYPSYDEPHLKATFGLTINNLKGYSVIANTLPIGPPLDIS